MCLACEVTHRVTEVERRLHPAPAEWLWTELAVLCERHGLREHPYVRAWRAGTLSCSDLQLLASEREHLVVATAVAVRRAPGLPGAALDLAQADLGRWRAFATSVGWSGVRACFYAEDPFPESVAVALTLAGRPGMSAAEATARVLALRVAEADGADALATLLEHRLVAVPVKDPFAVLAGAREALEALHRFYDRLGACREHIEERAA
jgi:hypothetical protein